MKSIELTREQRGELTILLNMELRSRTMALPYAKRLNDIFRQLTGGDHESMEWRKRKPLPNPPGGLLIGNHDPSPENPERWDLSPEETH